MVRRAIARVLVDDRTDGGTDCLHAARSRPGCAPSLLARAPTNRTAAVKNTRSRLQPSLAFWRSRSLTSELSTCACHRRSPLPATCACQMLTRALSWAPSLHMSSTVTCFCVKSCRLDSRSSKAFECVGRCGHNIAPRVSSIDTCCSRVAARRRHRLSSRRSGSTP